MTRDKIKKSLPLAISVLMLISLIMATAPVSAAGSILTVRPITLQSGGDGEAIWSAESYAGVSSVKLSSGTVANTSLGRAVVPVDIALAGIENISFWYYIDDTKTQVPNLFVTWPVYEQEGFAYDDEGYLSPYIVLEITDGTDTHWIISQPFGRDPDSGWTPSWEKWDITDNAPPDGTYDPEYALWHDESFTDNGGTGGSGTYPAGWEYLSFFQNTYDGYTVTKVKVVMGGWDITTNQSAYVDDLTVNGFTHELEEPDYNTIQAAITAAETGDTVLVYPGVYNEDLKIQDKANLTIRSESGRDVTTIQLTGVVKYGIELTTGADNTTIGGEAGHGFTIKGPATGSVGSFVISVNNAPSGVEISHNAIDTTGVASMGISVGTAGATGLTIDNNTFTGDENAGGEGSIWGPNVVDITVINNTLSGAGLVDYAIQFSGVTGTSIISGNTIENYKGAGAIVITNGTGTSGLTISNNDVSGCANGIRFAEESGYGAAGNMTTVTVTQNTLTNNAKSIRIGDGTHVLASNFTIENNNIVGSTAWGLWNQHTTEEVTATYNWWGDSSGPSEEGSGEGDAVSTNVNYNPWLLEPKDEPQTYYDHCEALESGWNMISTPKILESENLSEIIVGTILEFYTYDVNHWINTTSMEPLDAVFVKMGGSGGIGFEWTTNELVAPPTKQLEEGWNLVGSSVNIPSESSVPVNEALDSVSGSYSTVFSPACNLHAWTVTTTTAGTKSMLPYEGYWVYVLEPAELAGRTT